MRWSWRLGRIAGIELEVHATFLLLLAWVAFAEFQRTRAATATAEAVLFLLALFGSVVLHELGHALTGRRFGVRTRGITLLPIGGVARMERIPENPKHELAIALAGPAVTAAIIALLYALLRVTGLPTSAPQLETGAEQPFLARLMWINIALLVFNLLPAFPMDGGRVLRALVALRAGRARATAIAAQVGKAFAFLFGLFGLLGGNLILVIIALFVWIGAAGEAMTVRLTEAVQDVPVERVMATDLHTLSPDESVSEAVREARPGFQTDFPVVQDGRLVGILTRETLLKVLASGGAGLPVAEVMRRDFAACRADEPVDQAIARLQECHCRALPVLDGPQLVGLLTMDRIGEYVALNSAKRRRAA